MRAVIREIGGCAAEESSDSCLGWSPKPFSHPEAWMISKLANEKAEEKNVCSSQRVQLGKAYRQESISVGNSKCVRISAEHM